MRFCSIDLDFFPFLKYFPSKIKCMFMPGLPFYATHLHFHCTKLQICAIHMVLVLCFEISSCGKPSWWWFVFVVVNLSFSACLRIRVHLKLWIFIQIWKISKKQSEFGISTSFHYPVALCNFDMYSPLDDIEVPNCAKPTQIWQQNSNLCIRISSYAQILFVMCDVLHVLP